MQQRVLIFPPKGRAEDPLCFFGLRRPTKPAEPHVVRKRRNGDAKFGKIAAIEGMSADMLCNILCIQLRVNKKGLSLIPVCFVEDNTIALWFIPDANYLAVANAIVGMPQQREHPCWIENEVQ